MKRKLILLPIICTFAISLNGCGHEHVWVDATCLAPKTCSECEETEGEVAAHKWIEATCEKAKYCEVCGETEGEPLDHEWLEPTYTEPKTCALCSLTEGEPLPEPYCVKNNITFENLQDMELPFAAAFSKDGEIVEIDGLWADVGMAHYSFGEIRIEPSEQEGYIDVTIPYEVSLSAEVYLDTTKFSGGFRIEASWAAFSVGDIYTGLLVPSQGTYGSETNEYIRNYEWNGNTYTVSYTKDTNSESGFSDWTGGDESIYNCTFDLAADIVYTITVPEEYDGAVLAIERNGKDEVKLRTDEETDEKDIHFLDEHDADYYIFYQLSDLIQ